MTVIDRDDRYYGWIELPRSPVDDWHGANSVAPIPPYQTLISSRACSSLPYVTIVPLAVLSPAVAETSVEIQEVRKPRVFASRLNRVFARLGADPEYLMRRALYSVVGLASVATFTGAIGFAGAVTLVCVSLLIWGGASVVTYSITGKCSFDPRMGLLLLMVGIGTLFVELLSILA